MLVVLDLYIGSKIVVNASRVHPAELWKLWIRLEPYHAYLHCITTPESRVKQQATSPFELQKVLLSAQVDSPP